MEEGSYLRRIEGYIALQIHRHNLRNMVYMGAEFLYRDIRLNKHSRYRQAFIYIMYIVYKKIMDLY